MRGCRGRLDGQAANKQHAENSQDELSHFGLHGADQPLVTIKRSTRFDQVRSNLNRSKAPNGNVIMEVQAKGLVKICFNHPELLKTIFLNERVGKICSARFGRGCLQFLKRSLLDRQHHAKNSALRFIRRCP
jgi:hypothetical protein